jgi:hypothetical protein
MGNADRLYNLAKAYLDHARSRWDEVDSAAQRELNEALNSPALTAWERAQAKINATRSANQAAQEIPTSTVPLPNTPYTPDLPPTVPLSAAQPSNNALAGAYRVLDVPVGSDLLTVQKAYQELQKKADPNRFPAGSKDRQLAQDILRRVNAAYMMLANSLSATSDDRFDRLEL